MSCITVFIFCYWCGKSFDTYRCCDVWDRCSSCEQAFREGRQHEVPRSIPNLIISEED